MSKKLFEYAIIKQEKLDKDGEVVDEAAVVCAPTTILAEDVTEVNVIAARAIPEEQVANLSRLTIAVRPF